MSETTTLPELLRVVASVAGFLFTLFSIWFVGRSLLVVIEGIKRQTASFSGPRFRFTFGMTLAMVVFLVGWVGFLYPSIVSASLPPSNLPPERQLISDINSLSIVAAELLFAFGQAVILATWVLTTRPYYMLIGGRSSTATFVPPGRITPSS